MRLALSTALCALATAAQAAPFSLDSTPGQLPKTVLPSAYTIDLALDMRAATFTGREDIAVTVRQPTDTIVLNQAGLTVSSASLDGKPAAVREDQGAQTVTLKLAAAAGVGRHTLHVEWAGPIPTTPAGVYLDDYKVGGAAQRMVVTQFEVADARRMFPGWDEPAFKASFALTVTLPDDLAIRANMPEAGRSAAGPGLVRVRFPASPTMSSYLLAVVAGKMSAVQGRAGQTDLAVWAPTGQEQTGRYALGAMTSVLPYYNDYFATAFPLPKLDALAIPGNYQAGAMENWGAMTFIDNALLYDPQHSSPETQETVYLTVAHEMAHQWSGDLVTMGWWDGIWLNEGFATWMENKATDHFNPAWQVRPREHADHERSMELDATPGTHPMHYAIKDPSEAYTMFDLISYQKGSQVIRMIEDWVGPDNFRDGMRLYMRRHAYSNTTGDDLWAALSAASHKPVAAVASSFTEQPGIPLISAATACRDGTTEVTLTQSRFTVHDPHPKAQVWQVPVDVQAVGGAPADARQVAIVGAAPAHLRFTGCGEPIKVNADESGYFRTLYAAPALAALVDGFGGLGQADRANLLGDQYALFQSGQQPMSSWLDLLNHLTDERSYTVWHDTIERLVQVDQLERGQPTREAWRSFARGLLNPVLRRLGWTTTPGEPVLDTLLRPEVILALGQLDDREVAVEARARYAAFRGDATALAPSLRQPVLMIVGMHADQATWQQLRDAGLAATVSEDKLGYFAAMGAAHDPALISAFVPFATSGAVPNGRIGWMLRSAAKMSDAPERVWAAVLANQATIRGHLAPWGQVSLLPMIADISNDPAIGQALLAEPFTVASGGGRIAAARAVDAIGANHTLSGRMQAALTEWLGVHQG